MPNQRLQLQSRIINESQYQFGDPNYTTTEPQWQSTIDIKKSSTEQRIFKRGRLPCQISQDLPTSQKPTWRRLTETRTDKSTKKSTDKSAETRTDKSTEKSYRQVKSTPRGKSTKSTKFLLKPPIESATMKSTGWSPKRTSNDDWPSQAVSTSQCHLPMTTGCTIYSTEHAEAHCTELRPR